MDLNYEICAGVAARYTTRRDFRRESSREYQWLQRNGLFQAASVHMQPLRRSLSDAEILSIAAKYKSRRKFKLADQPAYNAAHKRGIIDSVCAHMEVRYRVFTDEQIHQIASRYDSKIDFLMADKVAYQTAYKRGILDTVCAHMSGRPLRRMSDSELLAVAKTYRTRNDLKLGDFGVYTTIIRRDLTEDAFAHMEPGSCGFREDEPAELYQFRLQLPCGQALYKVGITNREPWQRLVTMGIESGISVTLEKTIKFPLGRDARIEEKALHQRHSEHRYRGADVMNNGNTEVFLIPLI